MSEICLYTFERLDAVQARLRRCALRVALAVAAGVALCLAGIFLRQEWLCIGGMIAGAWMAYYVLDTRMRPLRAEAAFVQHMVGVQPGKMTVRWGEASPESVYVEGVRATQIRCSSEDGAKVFYLRAEDGLPEIPVGEVVKIESVDRFIVRVAPVGEN